MAEALIAVAVEAQSEARQEAEVEAKQEETTEIEAIHAVQVGERQCPEAPRYIERALLVSFGG